MMTQFDSQTGFSSHISASQYHPSKETFRIDDQALAKRFLHYVSMNTQSNEHCTTFPSTTQQLQLLKYLCTELQQIGLSEVLIDSYGYVTASLTATPGYESTPVIGFLAHVDTSPDLSGDNVSPQIIRNYNGKSISLGKTKDSLCPSNFPELKELIGHTLITTDGTTLLGADDKSGIAIIITAMEHLVQHPEISHGKIRVGFTPDEEIGRGVDFFDVEAFGASYAYTIDGGAEGELEYENFNAAGANITIRGRNIHPGSAKGKMINALQLAIDLHSLLPATQRPEHTDLYEGFYHLTSLTGNVEEAQMHYIIREHDTQKFVQLKNQLLEAVRFVNNRYNDPPIEISIEDQYYNMKKIVCAHPLIIDNAIAAIKEAGVHPILKPIRGGTDGARLSYMGLPCPNLFTGGANFHGRYEYCSLDSMCRSAETLLHLSHLWTLKL